MKNCVSYSVPALDGDTSGADTAENTLSQHFYYTASNNGCQSSDDKRKEEQCVCIRSVATVASALTQTVARHREIAAISYGNTWGGEGVTRWWYRL